MKHYGLIGKTLIHSFSQAYFSEKFAREAIDADYALIELHTIELFREIGYQPQWSGFNVTIPYKQTIIPYLDQIDPVAAAVGAVNCITIQRDAQRTLLCGHNTDIYGFKKTISPLLQPHHKRALILGTGGASKAVTYVLSQLGIEYRRVSRTSAPNTLTYADLTDHMIANHHIIINTTPLGTFPNLNTAPDIPYHALTSQHLLYDLVYNPELTEFLKQGKRHGAITKNGLEMLHLQAEEAYRLFCSHMG